MHSGLLGQISRNHMVDKITIGRSLLISAYKYMQRTTFLQIEPSDLLPHGRFNSALLLSLGAMRNGSGMSGDREQGGGGTEWWQVQEGARR